MQNEGHEGAKNTAVGWAAVRRRYLSGKSGKTGYKSSGRP